MDWFKPRIKYLTLVDFGLLTTVDEMELECKDWGVDKYSVTKCLECTYKEMHWALGVPGIAQNKVTQYLIDIHHK